MKQLDMSDSERSLRAHGMDLSDAEIDKLLAKPCPICGEHLGNDTSPDGRCAECRDSCLRAFTLLELLVVLAVVGVIIALLAPALGSSARTARATKCAANLRSLAQATPRPIPLAHEAITPREAQEWDVPAASWLCPEDRSERSISFSYLPGAFAADCGYLEHPTPAGRAMTEQMYDRYPSLPLFEDWDPVHSGARNRVGLDGGARSARPPAVP